MSDARRPKSGLVLAALLLAATGCRQDMHNSPKAIPLRESVFFKNGSSARPLVEDTVARGTLQDDAPFFTGKNGAAEVDVQVTPSNCIQCGAITAKGGRLTLAEGGDGPLYQEM